MRRIAEDRMMGLLVGDTTIMSAVPIPWDQVPSGALVRVTPDTKVLRLGHALRVGDVGRWADAEGNLGGTWRWSDGDWCGLVERIEILALDLTSDIPATEILALMLRGCSDTWAFRPKARAA